MISILHNQGTPLERQLGVTQMGRENGPVNIIKRNVRRDPPVQPGEEIYDRARIIFSRARRMGRSRVSSIF